MKNFRIGLVILAVIMLIIQLSLTDFSVKGWYRDSSVYLGSISMICLIIAMFISNRYEKKNAK